MAVQNILGMVRSRMVYLPVSATIDTEIGNFTIEQFYYLQKWTILDDNEVEDESKYKALQKMLVAELVCIELLSKKTLSNIAGENGGEATAGKRIKRGKADVVEAEFDYAKYSDGTFLGKTAEQLISDHAKKACEYAATLGYNLPMCAELGLCQVYDTPAFISYENTNLNCCNE